ncbi:MAG TPA: N-methyl-L-tryptophan oxidase [Acidimicrobiia bacterium]|nr:N-methyl-L-tryptophan oxidase [Acidimicrobiia bacterium]
MADKTYDVIVVGVGAMGSAAIHHLARRGLSVLGLEQFDIPNDLGSSHGVNRIFRLAYYEGPGYVPLMRRALDLWLDLETIAGEKLVHVTGSIDAGPADGDVFAGSLESCRIHGLDHEVLDSASLADRFPGYRLPEDTMSVFQPDGGFVLSERCIVAHVVAALANGAEVRARETVRDWQVTSEGGVRVGTDRGAYEATRLVLTAGAWAGGLIPELAALAAPERQVLGWFQPERPELFAPERFPVFNLAAEEGRYYGFPVFGIPGFKIGRYHHLEETTTPDGVNRVVDGRDERVLRTAVSRYFPDADGPIMTLKTCLFTNSPDEHFIVDSLPGIPQVTLAAGFSGHGFKFASVMGEILADLAQDGHTGHDISMFALSRFP